MTALEKIILVLIKGLKFLYYLYRDMFRDMLWVLRKVVGYLLSLAYFFWCVPEKVYPTLKLLVEGLSFVVDRLDSSGIILHKVILLLYLPIVVVIIWEFYRENALVIVDLFTLSFGFLATRSVYLFVITGQLQTNQAELWACFATWMALQAFSFLSLKDVRDFASKKVARQLLFYPKEVVEAEATLLSRSFL